MEVHPNTVRSLNDTLAEWIEIADKITYSGSPRSVNELKLDILDTYFRLAARLIAEDSDTDLFKLKLWFHIYGETRELYGDTRKSNETLSTSLTNLVELNKRQNFLTSIPIHIQDAVSHDILNDDKLASLALRQIGFIQSTIFLTLHDFSQKTMLFTGHYGRVIEGYLSRKGVLHEM